MVSGVASPRNRMGMIPSGARPIWYAGEAIESNPKEAVLDAAKLEGCIEACRAPPTA